MNVLTDFSLTTRRSIRVPAKRIYEAWLDPEMLTRFMLAAPGMTIAGASVDPRVGGRFDVTMVIDGKEMPHGGVYRELVPYERIVFDWESPHVSDQTTVTITLLPKGDTTEVVLVHTRFRDERQRDGHNAGWTAILAKLEQVLS
jgi:uncharacterized protein YndB with AHSA1/START domain